MIRRLLCRYLIRRAWALAMKSADHRNITGWQRWHHDAIMLNSLSLLTTVMGGNSGWMPSDVEADYGRRILHCDVIGDDSLGLYSRVSLADDDPPPWRVVPYYFGTVTVRSQL